MKPNNHRPKRTYNDLCYNYNQFDEVCQHCKYFNMNGFSAPSGRCECLPNPHWSDTFAGDVCDCFVPNAKLVANKEEIRHRILL